MAEKQVLGTVLRESGRMTQEDVERALDHQRTHGGYFGEAVVELGILRREEIDWALASQFDLPFIFPDADAADREAANLVTAEWALAHLAVPLVRAGDTVTVVVADPLDNETLEELRDRTGLDVEMALASSSRIRQLIRSVFGDSEVARAQERAPVRLEDFVTEALATGADRIGVSVRGTRAQGWYTLGESRERRPLEEGWADGLDRLLDRSPLEAAREAGGAVASYQATLTQGGVTLALDVQAMTSLSGSEFLLRPHRGRAAPAAPGLPDAVREELRLLAAGGHARVGVVGAAEVLPQLPALVLGDDVRAAHVTHETDVPGAFILRPESAQEGGDLAEMIASYAFDALTVDLPLEEEGLAGLLATVPLSFVLLRDPDPDPDTLDRAGISWILTSSDDQDESAWELRPTNR